MKTGATASVAAVDVPQLLDAVTVIFPAVVPIGVKIEALDDVPVQPVPGNVHIYDVAPGTAATLYVWLVPTQGAAGPVITVGCAGPALALTKRVLGVEAPQVDTAATLIVPLVADGVTVMLGPLLVPIHPPGNVQV
jgi:hypothetical protein